MKKITPEELTNILTLHQKWLADETGGERANLSDVDLSGSDLSNTNLAFSILNSCNLSDVDLSNTDLSFSTLNACNLINSNLNNTNLSNADLRFSIINACNLNNVNLSNTSLGFSLLNSCNLSNSDLSKADLYGAILNYTNFSNANLRGANLINANLYGANLQGTNLDYAILYGVNLDESSFPIDEINLSTKVDDDILAQMLYHILVTIKCWSDVPYDIKNLLIKTVNQLAEVTVMKTVTYEQFLNFNPCWLETEDGEKQPKKYKEWWGDGKTALDVLSFEEIELDNRLWTVLRPEFIEESILHEFACRCAERALSRIENPDPRSITAIETKRAWIRGEISDNELEKAEKAAWDAAHSSANAAAWAAAWASAKDAEWATVWVATRTAAWVAVWFAAKSAVGNATQDAARREERQWQVNELIKLLS